MSSEVVTDASVSAPRERFPSCLFEYYVKYKYDALPKNKLPNEELKALQLREFEKMTLSEKEALAAEYYDLRKEMHGVWRRYLWYDITFDMSKALQRVPIQLYTCSSDFIKLEDLPRDVFIRTLELMNAMDIFRMTSELRKAVFTFSSYLVEYGDHRKDLDECYEKSLISQHSVLSFHLAYWYCRLSTNVETLIFDKEINCIDLALLLQNCPNLKSLILDEHNAKILNKSIKELPGPVSLPKLEALVCGHYCHHQATRLLKCLIESSSNLRVLKCQVYYSIPFTIMPVLISKNIFSKLIALELTCFTYEALIEMIKVEDFQLRYLKLESLSLKNIRAYNNETVGEIKKHFLLLLPKMRRLEVLVLSGQLSMTKSILSMITKLQLNLRYGCFWYGSCFEIYSAFRRITIDEKEVLDMETLRAFRKMLLAKDPNRKLTDLVFCINKEAELNKYSALDLGFTFQGGKDFSFFNFCQAYIKQLPTILQYLDINF